MKKYLVSLVLSLNLYAEIAPDTTTIVKITDTIGQGINTINVATGGVFAFLTHGEIEYGMGSMELQGGFFGLNGTISDKVTTYTIKNEHANLFNSNLNINYKVSWYDSGKVDQGVASYNGFANSTNTVTQGAFTLPAINYKVQGLDADIGVGWDIVHAGKHDYLSIGPDIGISSPVLESTSSSSNSGTTSGQLLSFISSNTNMWTYKIGGQIRASKSLNQYLYLYASSIYAYQTARVENKAIGLNVQLDGRFNENEIGIRLQPLEYKYNVTSWFSIDPQLYFTAGWRYSQWTLDKISVDLFNTGIPLHPSKFQMTSSASYVGIGYSF